VTPVKLSICIPVYNFGAFLGPTLESIVPQAGEAVEIVVLDGGSTDDTPAVVARFQERFPRLTYLRRDQRGGIDRDMAHAVAAARGEYLWLFSGDDLMRPDAVARLLAELPSGCDVYLLESLLCGFHMNPIAMHRLLEVREPRTFRLGDAGQRLAYFRLALNSAAFFSFCSALVIRKACWDSASIDESFYGSCWAHAARLLSLVPSGLTVRYLPGAFLDKRGDNDSFLDRGRTVRLAIAVDGYHRIAGTFFGASSPEAFHIRRALRADVPVAAFALARLEIADRNLGDQLPLYRRLVRAAFGDVSPANLLRIAFLLGTPVPVLRLARRAQLALRRLTAAQARGASGGPAGG
jgi:abequosyltransferase